MLGGTTNEYGVPFKPDGFLAAVNLVERLKRDLDSPNFQAIASGEKQPLVAFRGALAKLDPIVNALVTPDKHLRLATVCLMSKSDQFRLSGQRIGLDLYRAIELRARDRQRKLISKIDAALQRIEDNTYGYCEETGEPISLKRLEARPIATLSVEAQERHEKREKVYRDE